MKILISILLSFAIALTVALVFIIAVVVGGISLLVGKLNPRTNG